jgi:hypothetical protein
LGGKPGKKRQWVSIGHLSAKMSRLLGTIETVERPEIVILSTSEDRVPIQTAKLDDIILQRVPLVSMHPEQMSATRKRRLMDHGITFGSSTHPQNLS